MTTTTAPSRAATHGDTPAPPSTPRPASWRHSRGRVGGARTERRHWSPKPSGAPDPAGHLTPDQIDALAAELDALREEALADRGARDAAYIRRVIAAQRALEAGSRLVLLFSRHRAAWIIGTTGLAVAKSVENMEIGHNVMHGQWDWMRDPAVHSSTWEWDHVAPATMWKHSHNETHHTYTNVIGADNDLGYGILRVDPDQPWHPVFLGQPLWNLVNAVMFQYSIAFYDLELGRYILRRGRHTPAEQEAFRRNATAMLRKVGRHTLRDYVLHPLLSGPSWRSTMTANFTANLARNLWSNTVIICGHFPTGVETFSRASIEGESRGEWYLRQMLGSANISGSRALHFATGNLSHQIEHHMFPDLPSNRYYEIAPQVRAIFARYGLPYVTGPLPVQYARVWATVFRHALPNGAWEELREAPVATTRRGLRWVRDAVRSRATRRRPRS